MRRSCGVRPMPNVRPVTRFRLCDFRPPRVCRWGDACTFAHSEEELNVWNRQNVAYEYGKKMVYSLKDSVNNAIVKNIQVCRLCSVCRLCRLCSVCRLCRLCSLCCLCRRLCCIHSCRLWRLRRTGYDSLDDCSHQCSAHGARIDLTRPLDCVGGGGGGGGVWWCSIVRSNQEQDALTRLHKNHMT